MTKTKKRAPLAEAMSFAHLLPLTAGTSARAEDDDDKDKGPDADNDEEGDNEKPSGKKAKKARADDQGNDDGEDDGADGDGDEDGADADSGENDDGDSEDDKKPAGKKAKKARADDKDGDGEDDEKEDGPSARAGAMRERRRCAAIFGSRHAAGRPDLAAHLAFNTTMSAAEAIGTMKTLVGGERAGARSARKTLADRMQTESVPNPGQGASAAPTGAKGLAAAMLAASKKAQGTSA